MIISILWNLPYNIYIVYEFERIYKKVERVVNIIERLIRILKDVENELEKNIKVRRRRRRRWMDKRSLFFLWYIFVFAILECSKAVETRLNKQKIKTKKILLTFYIPIICITYLLKYIYTLKYFVIL